MLIEHEQHTNLNLIHRYQNELHFMQIFLVQRTFLAQFRELGFTMLANEIQYITKNFHNAFFCSKILGSEIFLEGECLKERAHLMLFYNY